MGRIHLLLPVVIVNVPVAASLLIDATQPADWPEAGPSPTSVVTETVRAYLPLLIQADTPGQVPFPHPALAEQIWRSAERFGEEYPPASIYPGYLSEAGGPLPENVAANLDAACHDFPDLPDVFGSGAHRAACYEWVADYLGLYHSVRAYRTENAEDIAWAQHYLDAALDYVAAFVYGRGDGLAGPGYRDTRAAVHQNPLRAVDIVLIADLLRRMDALEPERQQRAEELLSGIARAWYAEFWMTGVHPSTGMSLTVRTAPEVEAHSLDGRPVVTTVPHTFAWDADKGNTPAEEVAWMGAGVMLASRALGSRLPDGEDLYEAGRHYVDFAIAYDRADPVHGGTVRTLNAETSGGAYGQRRYWIENHAPDTPSIPYMGSTWHFVSTALLASPLGEQDPWPTLVPNETQWWLMQHSAEQTLHSPSGTLLVDFAPGGGIGFDLDGFPAWWMPCGHGLAGRQYVRHGTRGDGAGFYISEIGHPAGLDLLMSGWSIMRLAAARNDVDTYQRWEQRMRQVLNEYIARPPNPGWAECKVAPYVSTNPGYHWARMLAVHLIPYLGASGYALEPWHSAITPSAAPTAPAPPVGSPPRRR